MYMLVAIKQGKPVEWVPGFADRRDAKHEADRLNALPAEWQDPDGRRHCRPQWKIARQPGTLGNRGVGTGMGPDASELAKGQPD